VPDFSCRFSHPMVNKAIMTLSPLGRQRLSILIYHRVLREKDWMRPGTPTAVEFAWKMRMLRRHFTFLPLPEAIRLLRNGALPPRAACVTFDDGYADNFTVALPILQRYAIPATVFVATGFLDGGRMWNDTVVESLRYHPTEVLDLSEFGLPVYVTDTGLARRRAAYDIIMHCKYLEPIRRRDIIESVVGRTRGLPDDLMLTTTQLRDLHRQGVEIGGHTCFHPILSSLSLTRAREEIIGGKNQLEDIIGEPLRLFAYPNGRPNQDYLQEHVALVKEAGFEAAVSTQWGVAGPRSDPFQLPRFTPWDKSSTKFLLRMALNSCRVAPPGGVAPC